jgi:signal transduction histidine kinase
MIADALPLTPVVAQRLHLSLSVGMALLGVVFLYWVGLAADESLDSTFVAGSVWHMAAVQLGGGVMVLVGLTSSIVHPDRVIGLLAAGLGLTWLAPEVAGWVDGPQWIRSAALPLGVLFVPLLLHIGLRYPIGRSKSRLHRRLTTLAYAAGTTVALSVAFLYEPFLDLHCWRNCSSSPYVLFADPGLSRSMIRVSMWTAAALSMVVVWGASARAFSKSPREPGVSRWLLGPLVVLAVTEVTYPLLVLHRPRVDPSDPVLSSLVLVGGILLAAIGLGIAWDLMHDVRRRRSLADLVTELEAGASSSLASALANSLGDTTVEVAYWIPSLQRHVDSEGRDVSPTSGLGRAVVTLERAGVELGKVIHGSHLSAGDLGREIGAAARLAVDNERLRAELLAQANEIRVSQERIVAAGDDARRRLERDLHDGAQQSLLALSYKLRIAETEARRAGADKWALALSGAIGDVLTTIEEVRRLAHGIFPSILVDAGMVRALETLREESDVQLEIDLPDKGCGNATAIAIYQLVAAVVNAPGLEKDARTSITGQKVDGLFIVDVYVQEPVAASALIRAVDRIGALGGSFDFRETGVHVELPCE